MHFNECPTLQNKLEHSYPQHSHRTRSSTKLILPFPRVAGTNLLVTGTSYHRILDSYQHSKNLKTSLIDFYTDQYVQH